MCSPHYPVTVTMVTDQIHLEFGIDDEKDGDDEDKEVEEPEEVLVLAFQDNRYLLLLAVNSNTPLEMLKQVLRVYVWKVCSRCSSSGHCELLTILISEFQKLSGRILWAAIWANNEVITLMLGIYAPYTFLYQIRIYLSFFGFLSFINSYLYEFITCHV